LSQKQEHHQVLIVEGSRSLLTTTCPKDLRVRCSTHGRNFVVKCGGTAWCESNIVIRSMYKWRFIYADSQSYL